MKKIITFGAALFVAAALLYALFLLINDYIYNEKQEPNPVPDAGSVRT